MTNADQPHALIYLRGKREDERAAQETALRRLASDRGYTVAGVFADDGGAGRVVVRPGLDGLRAAVASGRGTVVLVYDLARFGRVGTVVADLFREWDGAGVVVETPRGSLSGGPGKVARELASGPAGGLIARRRQGDGPVRAVIYVRVSTDGQVDGTSLDEQIRVCRAFCEAKGWNVVAVFREEGASGAKASRPELDRLMLAVRAGEVDAVVVAKLDRFGRSVRHLAPTLGEFDDAGVIFASVAESLDSSTMSGRLLRNILGSIAEFERDTIAQRMRSGRQTKIAAGNWSGGIPPYGYRGVKDAGRLRLEINEDEARVIREMVRLIVEETHANGEHLGAGEVARRLNAQGLYPRTLAAWHAGAVRLRVRKAVWDGTWTWARPGKAKVHEPITHTIPAIIPADRLELARVLLLANRKRPATSGQATVAHLLSGGRLRCPCCGEGMAGRARQGKARVDRYTCQRARPYPGREQCQGHSVLAGPLDNGVWSAVSGLLSDPDRLRAIWDAAAPLPGDAEVDSAELDRLDGQIATLTHAITTTVVRLGAAGLDADAVQAATVALQDQLTAAKRQRAMLGNRQHAEHAAANRAEALASLATLARTRLANATPQDKIKIMEMFRVRVQVVENPANTWRHRAPVKIRISGALDHAELPRPVGITQKVGLRRRRRYLGRAGRSARGTRGRPARTRAGRTGARRAPVPCSERRASPCRTACVRG